MPTHNNGQHGGSVTHSLVFLIPTEVSAQLTTMYASVGVRTYPSPTAPEFLRLLWEGQRLLSSAL